MKIYQDETAIREEFEREIKPKLLRYIFSAISKAMFIKDKVREGKGKRKRLFILIVGEFLHHRHI